MNPTIAKYTEIIAGGSFKEVKDIFNAILDIGYTEEVTLGTYNYDNEGIKIWYSKRNINEVTITISKMVVGYPLYKDEIIVRLVTEE